MSLRRPTTPERLSPALERIIAAAERGRVNAEGADIRNLAPALREFGSMAEWVLPIYGVFVPNDDKVSAFIEGVATRHLHLAQARMEFRKAVDTIEPFERRDAIESAHNHVRAVTEEAYFYAGLALGITMLGNCFRRPGFSSSMRGRGHRPRARRRGQRS